MYKDKGERIVELEEAIRSALFGELLDEYNRDDNGLIPFNQTKYAIKVLKEVLNEKLN